MKRIRLLMAAVALLFSVGGTVLLTASAAAESPSAVVCKTVADNNNCSGTPKNSLDLNKVIGAVINILSTVVGIAAVLMVVIGGFRYITAAGDSGKIASARNTIIYALVGVVIAALAQALVKFVLNKATS